MLTSEYAVLDGALALAVPTRQGQELYYEEQNDGKSLIRWEAFHQEELWLSVTVDYSLWKILETNIQESAEFVLKLLKFIQNNSADKFKGNSSYFFKTKLQFPPDFGWGSSSTLIHNLAEWAGVDPFQMNEECLGGSGYDIAVAQQKSAILYQLKESERIIQKVDFKPSFADDLILVHLNQKQDTREGILHYRSKKVFPEFIEEFSEITRRVLNCENLIEFSDLMEHHEQKMSRFLQLPTVKEKFFNRLPVFVKSLGAWGGDFVLSTKFDGYQDVFSELGFSNIFNYSDVID